jgi:surfeit locus 1 family protein
VRDPAPAPRRRRGLLVPTLLVSLGFAVLVSLGTWQLERKAWKDALIDTLSRRLAAPAAVLPPPELWPSLDAQDDEFRRVVFRAELLNDQEALVYTSGSSLRSDARGPGYWVFTPARLPNGRIVVVDRGFVPQTAKEPKARTAGQVAGPIDITGVMRWPEQPGLFTPRAEPERNLWFARDHLEIAAARHWPAVAPFYVEQEAPAAPGGLPSVSPLQVRLPNNHLQYAVTWYALAAVLAVVFALYARGHWRKGPESAA